MGYEIEVVGEGKVIQTRYSLASKLHYREWSEAGLKIPELNGLTVIAAFRLIADSLSALQTLAATGGSFSVLYLNAGRQLSGLLHNLLVAEAESRVRVIG